MFVQYTSHSLETIVLKTFSCIHHLYLLNTRGIIHHPMRNNFQGLQMDQTPTPSASSWFTLDSATMKSRASQAASNIIHFYTEISVCIFIIHSARVDYVLSLLRTSFKSKKPLQNACSTNLQNFLFLDPFCWLFLKYFMLCVAKEHLGIAFEILPTESNDTFDEPWQSFCSANTRHVTWIVKRRWVIPNKPRVTGLFQKNVIITGLFQKIWDSLVYSRKCKTQWFIPENVRLTDLFQNIGFIGSFQKI